MEQPQRKQNPIETEPIGRLICRYSIPTALTLMVNYLYNIVDQIFVGQGVGVMGMAATNVAFPLTIVTIALALMIGDGCAANMSLCLGRRQQEEADRTASHTVTLLVAAGVFLAVGGSLFARQIVLLFGAILTHSEVYSGVYGRASITFYAFNNSGNRGIACGLNNLQKIRDGEPLGGKASAESDFATDEDDDFLD